MRFGELRYPEDLERLVEEVGFLPFFAGDIEGFSVEECCPPELWFAGDVDGPWEWKGLWRGVENVFTENFLAGKPDLSVWSGFPILQITAGTATILMPGMTTDSPPARIKIFTTR